MQKDFFLVELQDLYETLKKEQDYKTSLHVLKLIASVKGFLQKTNPAHFSLQDLSDTDLAFLLEKVEAAHA